MVLPATSCRHDCILTGQAFALHLNRKGNINFVAVAEVKNEILIGFYFRKTGEGRGINLNMQVGKELARERTRHG